MGCFFKLVPLLTERVILFVRGLVTDHAMQPVFVVPLHPFHNLPFELAFGFPRAEVFDDLGFEHPDDGFGQCVVVAVSNASDRHVDSDFGKPFGVSNRHILHAGPSGGSKSTAQDIVGRWPS